MARYQVILIYDGTEFRGFQRQGAGSAHNRTVQGVFEDALRRLNWQGQAVLAAGRTDTGVHARGQVVSFDLNWAHSTEELQAALNSHLPGDVAVRTVRRVQPGFHPRYDALARRYCYRIFCDPWRDPLKERYAWRVWPAVEVSNLQEAARTLTGTHDFAAFGTPPRTGGGTIRTVFHAFWAAEDDQDAGLVFEISANAFLYRMVRRLVFVQVAIGQGKYSPDFMRQCLDNRYPHLVQGLAPPQGLALEEVVYPEGVVLQDEDQQDR